MFGRDHIEPCILKAERVDAPELHPCAAGEQVVERVLESGFAEFGFKGEGLDAIVGELVRVGQGVLHVAEQMSRGAAVGVEASGAGVDLNRRVDWELFDESGVLVGSEVFDQRQWQQELLVEVPDQRPFGHGIASARDGIDLGNVAVDDVEARGPCAITVIWRGWVVWALVFGRVLVCIFDTHPFGVDDLRVFLTKIEAQVVEVGDG